MGETLPYRQRGKTQRKTIFARWSYLPWQPLAMLLLIAITFLSIQFVDSSRKLVAAEMDGQGETMRVATAHVPMPLCRGWPRTNCVIDGDTIWYQGEKIRIADINAPETHDPHCAYEAELGHKATRRMIELLNAGPFEIVSTGERDEDRYGRKLRLIERNGTSLGMVLVGEGLAERWQGYRRDWCS